MISKNGALSFCGKGNVAEETIFAQKSLSGDTQNMRITVAKLFALCY